MNQLRRLHLKEETVMQDLTFQVQGYYSFSIDISAER